MKVLVTGGRGFLGGHVCEALTAAGHDAIPLGRIDGDLAEPGVFEALLDEHAPDAVVHLAAAMPDDERLAQNAPITELVAHACTARGIRLLHGSTTSVYADDTPYAESKRASEKAAGDATILRFAFPYGPGQRRGAIPTMLRQALAREPIVVYRGWERSFCFAADAARAVVLLLDAGATGAHDVGRDDDPRTLLRDRAARVPPRGRSRGADRALGAAGRSGADARPPRPRGTARARLAARGRAGGRHGAHARVAIVARMKTVLFLGAGRHQRAAILHAKELGLRVAAIDGNPDALALDDADIAEVVNFVDIPSAVAFAEKIRPDGVLTITSDRAVVAVAAVAEALGLAGIGVDVAIGPDAQGRDAAAHRRRRPAAAALRHSANDRGSARDGRRTSASRT